MGKIELIKQAIKDADNNVSKLSDTEALNIQGFTGFKVKHLLNNLGAISNNYLEVGIHKLSTFVAANYKNEMFAIGIDNYSQFEEGGVSKKMAYEHLVKYLDKEKHHIVEEDAFIWSKESADLEPFKFDFYMFDGDHSYESQLKALTYFKPYLADEFILVVDDFSWDDVKRGTTDGIFKSNMKILYQNQLGMDKESDGLGYWNGLFVGLIKNN